MVEATVAADAVKALADAQARIAEALNGGAPDEPPLRAMGGGVFAATLAAQEKLAALKKRVEERAKTNTLSFDAASALESSAALLRDADKTDAPMAAEVVPSNETFHIAQVLIKPPFPYKAAQPSKINLGQVYQELNYLATSEGGFTGVNGRSFTQQEIDEAFESGKGPYLKKCSKISFAGDRNCKVVTNPADKSREVLITREAGALDEMLTELEAAFAANDEARLSDILKKQPSLINFIADDKDRWKSPVGTWRLRLLQDTGAGLGGPPGYVVLSDAETYIQAPKGRQNDNLSSGTFLGLIAIWMPSTFLIFDTNDVLNNFAMKFEWDSLEQTLSEGEIRGERREEPLGDGKVSRYDYSAGFEGKLFDGNRIRGYWFNDEKDMAGRFEMIRGTANYSI